MALDDNELNRRRQEREFRRQQQIREQKKLILKLVIAAAVILVCTAVIVVLALRGGNAPEQIPVDEGVEEAPQTIIQATNSTEATSIFNRDPTTVIHIRAGGDLNITDLVVQSGLNINGYDYTAVFQDVVPVLSDADLTMLNFEGILYGAPYGTETTSAPQELVEALHLAGVDILQTANTCTLNKGLIGLQSTLSAIRAAGIEPVGAFSTPEEFRKTGGFTICEIRGVRVAIVAFTKGVGRGVPAGSEDTVNLLYNDHSSTYQDVDTDFLNSILKAVENEDPDITIAMVHWGMELNDIVSESQERIVSLMQKRGVDVILGTHPHLVQEITYDEATGNLVAYSLGDFFGDGVKGGTNYSIILDVEITMDNDTGKTRVTNYTYTPIYTLSEAECDGQRRVVRIAEAMAAYDSNYVDRITKSAYDAMEKALTRIEERICTTIKIECPDCGKSVEVLARTIPGVGTFLGKQATCSCGNVLPVNSNISDYD